MREQIERVMVTPVAFPDPPLLSAAGVHEPLALRAILQVQTTSGAVGFGECHGGARLLQDLHDLASSLIGLAVSDVNTARLRAAARLPTRRRADRAFSPFEVAMLDAFARHLGVRVVDLLGGARREHVEFSGYLFYKWGRHIADQEDDHWGETRTPEDMVAQARAMHARHGFGSWKVKGGVHPIEEEMRTVFALRKAFPGSPVRIDPN